MWRVFLTLGALLLSTSAFGQDETSDDAKPAKPSAGPCVVTLDDGSSVHGEKLVGLTDRVLTIESSSAPDPIKISWSRVTQLECGGQVDVVLNDGTRLLGELVVAKRQFIAVRTGALRDAALIALWRVVALNPPPVDLNKVVYRGDIGLGTSLADGNTNARNALLTAAFEARSRRHRLTANALWNYAENQGALSARNSKAGMQYDFFVQEKTYAFVGARLEEDSFADLNLRSTLNAGFGRQFVDRGHFKNEWVNGIRWLKDAEFKGELGLAYISEDFRLGTDRRSLAARWSATIDIPVNGYIRAFHRHQGYPGLEDLEDIYVTSQQGIAVDFWNGFRWTAQVNWDWDNTPSGGFERSQFLYMMTIGYHFEI